LKRIPNADVKRLIAVIRELADNPRPPGVCKLAGEERYRVRQGDYRILYSIQDEARAVWIVQIAHCKDVYRP